MSTSTWRSKRLLALSAGLIAFSLMAFTACGSDDDDDEPSGGNTPAATKPAGSDYSDLSGQIAADGSSTVGPITEAVAEEFGKVSKVQVAVGISGTGGGFEKFCKGETDINNASRPIKKDDAKEGAGCAANNVEYVEFKVAIDGLTVVINPDNDFATCMTFSQLKKLWDQGSTVSKWNELDPAWPDNEIKLFSPGADSGTFDYFTEEINGETDAATTHATQSEDDNVLVTGVAGDVNAITFFGYAYFVEHQDKLKSVEVDGGDGCVAPTETTINDGTYTPLSRPLFIYPDVGKAKERPELKAFVDFFLENTNTLSAEVGYIALPDDLLAAEKAEWAAAVGG